MTKGAGRPRGRVAPSRSRRAGPKHIKKGGPVFKLLLRALLLLLVFVLCAALALFFWSLRPGEGKASVVHFEVASADESQVAEDLHAAGLVDSARFMGAYLGYLSPGLSIEVRSHLLRTDLSPREIMQRLGGKGSRPRREVTLPEGFHHIQIAARLEENEICSAAGFRRAVRDEILLAELAIEGPSAEGYLFPARYPFLVDSDPGDVVKRLVAESRKRLNQLLAAHPQHPDLGRLHFQEYEILTLASIVERETALQAERPRVARVFLNRLLWPDAETKGRLQSDPTAAYGCIFDPTKAPSCADFSGRVNKEMLRDGANAYNTYRHEGLPPGPISNPGGSAILAVLSPQAGEELYFVADSHGGHTFTVSYEEHLEAVKRLKDSQ